MRKVLLCSIIPFLFQSLKGQKITIDFSTIQKTNIQKGAASMNLCWLLDSDKHRPNKTQSMESAIKEVGVGSLRFPYGHLADNYLWHKPPYDAVEKGLRPKVASKYEAPAKWEWAINKNGTFKKAMDFDEYMQLCQRLNIKPLVVVNVLAHKYKEGKPSTFLVNSAREWAKYAKAKGYRVAYWQIGDQMDLHQDLLPFSEYMELYPKFAKAIKGVLPNAKIGPGVQGKTGKYTKAILEQYPKLISFTSAHQRMPTKGSNVISNYDKWLDNTTSFVNAVKRMQGVLDEKKSSIEILVTETGVYPASEELGWINNTYKALWFFEVLMDELSVKNVSYVYFWSSHSPWRGEKDNEKEDVDVLFRLEDNSRKPIAEVMKFVNENMPSNLIATQRIYGDIRVYAGTDDKGKPIIFLLNKLTKARKVDLSLLGYQSSKFQAVSLYGDKPYSRTLDYSEFEVNVSGDAAIAQKLTDFTEGTKRAYDGKILLRPLSITILR